jgi:predicted lipoprotein with Yx(FWY)xxD motif
MRWSLLRLTVSTACVFAAGACVAGNTASSPRSSPASSPTKGAAAGVAATHGVGSNSPTVSTTTTISVASTRLGQILVDGSGRTVYLFEADKGTNSTCYNACAQAWPPVNASGAPHATGAASPALLGTTRRKDGTTQVTYAGHPLYYFIADKKPGDMNGQGLSQFGAKWYVLAPSGKKIDTG